LSLRVKAVLVVVAIALGFVVAQYLGAAFVLSAGFERVERDVMERSVATFEGHMPFEFAVVAERLAALAPLEDLGALAVGGDAADLAGVLDAAALRDAGLAFALVLDAEDRVMHGVGVDGVDVEGVASTWRATERSADRGWLRVPDAVLLVASAPLVRPGTQEVVGEVVAGRRLDAPLLAVIEELTHLEVAYVRLDAVEWPPGFAEARDAIARGEARPLATPDERTIVGFAQLRDVADEPALLFRVATERPIAEQARRSRVTLMATAAAVGIVAIVLAVVALQRGLLVRFLGMSRTVRQIAADGDPTRRIAVQGADELGLLGDDVNGMLAALQRSQEALRTSEARLALAAEGANDGLWDWDVGTGTAAFSARFAALVGLPAAEVVATIDWWRARVHPDDLPRFDAVIAAVRSGATAALEDEHRVRLEDGSWRWMLARGAAIREGDAAVRVAGSLTDLTERGVFDPLTGLPNRVPLIGRLERAREAGRRPSGGRPVLLAVELERFDLVVSGLGREGADQLLIETGRRIANVLRFGDLLARTTPHGFVALVGGVAGSDEVEPIVARLHACIAEPVLVGDETVRATATIGAVGELGGYRRADDVLRDAAIAIDHARGERSPFAWFDRAMHDRVRLRQRTEGELRAAIEQGGLELAYQPLVDLERGTLHGFEALVRWPHPTRGLLPPAAFIELAEDTGLIVPLGAWVVREAVAAVGRFRAASAGREAGDVVMHLNVSARQLGDPDLAPLVARALAAHAVRPDRIHLEVTESVVMDRTDVAATALARLGALGVGLAIDDFGTGHSSLAYLHDLPVDTVKVDRSFVSRMVEDDRSRSIVTLVVRLAATLGMEVVAEGIETEAQADALRLLGVRYGQGYGLGRPVPFDEAVRWRWPEGWRLPST
jgi:diguanylate cyclase (GGDEF)-like protein/PAS domain S-box-containing protein